jgi:2-iminobutanoate/2-iminopropanoate deaminase
MHERVSTDKAPKAIGPYVQATVAYPDQGSQRALVFCSGQIPVDPATGQVVPGGIREQTRRVIQNLEAVLRAADCTLADVAKTTVYMKDLGEFAEMNEEYAKHFPANLPPARATVEVARLPKDVKVEIDCIALRC